jgi:hypothetical protein
VNAKLALALVIGLVLGCAVSFVARQPQVEAQVTVKAAGWEYRVVACAGDALQGQEKAAKTLTSQFNGLAAAGWEHVGPVIASPEARTMVRQTDAYSLVLFKRAKR